MHNLSCVFRAAWSACHSNRVIFLPKLWPCVWGCKKERTESFLYDNEFGVVIYARTCPKHGSGDVREQGKAFTPDDIANMFVGVPHAVN